MGLLALILLLIGAFRSAPHHRSWGYGTCSGLGLLVVVPVVLLLLGRP